MNDKEIDDNGNTIDKYIYLMTNHEYDKKPDYVAHTYVYTRPYIKDGKPMEKVQYIRSYKKRKAGRPCSMYKTHLANKFKDLTENEAKQLLIYLDEMRENNKKNKNLF